MLRFIVHRNDSHVVNHTNAREMKCKMLQFWRSTSSRTDMTSLRRWRKKQPLRTLKVTMLTALRRWTEGTSFPSVERDDQANWSQCHLVFLSIPKHTTLHMIWRTRKTKSEYLCSVFFHKLIMIQLQLQWKDRQVALRWMLCEWDLEYCILKNMPWH